VSRILSIDIGLSGALCWIEDGEVIEIFNTPTLKVKKAGGKIKKIIDYKELDRIFLNVSPDICVLEFVHSMPGQGVSSSFLFGETFGAVKAMSYTYADEVIIVSPQKWKEHFDLINTPKRAATELAKSYTKKVTNSGKADAFLIGKWYMENNHDSNMS